MQKPKGADSIPELCDKQSKQSSLTTEEEDRLLTTAEAAKFLRIPVSSLHTMTSNGKVPVMKLGRRNRYSLQDLRNLLWRNRRGGIDGN
jgi:excisionase family DNA binding protein